MSRDFRSSRVNRDRRDQAFARSVIAEATRRQNMINPQGGDEHVIISADRPVEYGALDGNTIKVRPCCNGNDPACPTQGVAASNARQNDYWQRVGGHPDAGHVDVPDKECCIYCGTPLDCDPEPNHPYCSTQCAVDADNDSKE